MEIRLYIGEHRVELDKEPSILYSYTVTDYSNPTAVRNGHSKTVTIKGTPNNNKIFGQYWKVERAVGNGGPNAGIYYNASKKAPFKLFVGSELYESGYVRLDKINRVDKEITYDCTLFSGLGDFFYNLAYNPNTGDKLKLADLNYYTGGADEFDFTVTATTVYEAWESLRNDTDNKWQHINFMPAYNGKPSDFNADKVIINLEGTPLPQMDESGLFRPLAGSCVIADLPQEMTEWEMRDLRSYNQRPCIRMKSIIDACCDPDQNGGYTVELDPDFFSSNNEYYSKTWLSLPMMKNLEYTNQEQYLEGSTLVGLRASGNGDTYVYQDLKFGVGDFGNTAPSSINIGAEIFVNNIFNNINTEVVDPIFGHLAHMDGGKTSFLYFYRNKGDSVHNNWLCLGSLYVQIIALNGETVVGASEAYNLTTPVRHNGKLYFGHNGHYSVANQYKPYMDKNIYDVLGEFKDDGFHREGSSSPSTINFHINGLQSPISALKVVYFWGATDDKIKRFSKQTLFCQEQDSDLIAISNWFVDTGCTYNPSTEPTVYAAGITSCDLKAVLGDNSLGRSGTKVTKALLLNTKDSPMDYLLSYAKTFGLYFTKVLGENKIKIETRKTFYDRTNVVNLNDFIDRSKDIKINPITFNTKWYELSHEMDETEYSKKYESARGVQYGSRILNTGYEFDVKKEKLLSSSVIRSGIEGLERSKFFSAYNNDNALRSWMGMGLHYNLYLFDQTADVDVPISNQNNLMGINENEGMKYYDIFPKMQFHGEGNDPTDGNNVLVFFSGFKDVEQGRSNPISYYLSDDNAYQTIYNDGTPCWLFTPSETISGVQLTYKVRYLPVFERYLTNNGSGTINKSLDFGTPQELYIPDYSITEDVNIYSNFWQSYLEDLFDPDNKVLECYVHIRGRIGDEWMRRFYWFDNCVWRLNKVTDWAVGELGTTQMEFVRVQDIDGYNSVTQHAATRVSLSSNCYAVDYTGDTITLTVGISNGGNWRLTATDGAILSRSNGMGNGTVTVTIPTNNSSGLKYWYFTVTSDDGASARISVSQSYEGETDFRCDPEDLIIPASGGNAFVNFIWTNQGEEYIQGVDYNESSDYLQFTADLDTYRSQNKALLGFSANTGNTVLHNYCQFQSREGICHSVGIDQVPDIFNFDASGGSATLSFDYNSAVTITAPEWIDVTKNGNTFTITARPNLYESENNANLVIKSGKSNVSTRVRQTASSGGGGGGGTPTNVFDVTPSNLYFTSGGGTQFITITATQNWYYKPFGGEWWNLSASNGNGNMTIGLTAPANSGSARSNYAEFGSMINGSEVVKRVYVSQDVSGSTPSFSASVSPNTTTVAQSGESINYTITVSSMNGISLEISASRDGDYANATIGNVTWQGNTGYVTITYPANNTYNAQRTWSVLFYFKQGNTLVGTYSMNPTQDGSSTESGSQGGGSGSSDTSGGTENIPVSSNTCWVTVYGEPTINAITLDTDQGDNAYIDTGIVPNSGYTMRLKYITKGVSNGGIIFGSQEGNDNEDWRFFMPSTLVHYGYMYFDYNSNRTSYVKSYWAEAGNEIDVTMTQNTVYDNNAGNYLFDKRNDWGDNPWLGSGSIVVDTRTVWVKEFWIWDENNNLVFHGIPYPRSYDEYETNRINRQSVFGLWDTVTNRLFGLSSAYTGSGELMANIYIDETQDWFSVTPSGCGDGSYTITTQENNTPNARWGYVGLYSSVTGNRLDGGIGYYFKQEPLAERLLVTPTSLVFDSNGGTATFTITSNTNWIIE